MWYRVIFGHFVLIEAQVLRSLDAPYKRFQTAAFAGYIKIAMAPQGSPELLVPIPRNRPKR